MQPGGWANIKLGNGHNKHCTHTRALMLHNCRFAISAHAHDQARKDRRALAARSLADHYRLFNDHARRHIDHHSITDKRIGHDRKVVAALASNASENALRVAVVGKAADEKAVSDQRIVEFLASDPAVSNLNKPRPNRQNVEDRRIFARGVLGRPKLLYLDLADRRVLPWFIFAERKVDFCKPLSRRNSTCDQPRGARKFLCSFNAKIRQKNNLKADGYEAPMLTAAIAAV